MNLSDINSYIQTAIFLLTLCAATYAAYWAKKIGVKQNSIDSQLLSAQKQSLEAQDFVELSVLPRFGSENHSSVVKINGGDSVVTPSEIVITGIGVYPIYLSRYILQAPGNDIHPLGSVAIPSDGYTIPIPVSAYPQKGFNLTVEFEDHHGNKYESTHQGIYYVERAMWEIISQKKSLMNKNK